MRFAMLVCVGSLLAACASGPALPATPGLMEATIQPTATAPGAATLPPPTATRDVAPTAAPVLATAAPTPSDGTLLIQVGDYFFEPAYITVTVGTKVIWHPVGELFHTIVPKSPPNAWRGGVTAGMGSRDFEWTFNRPGTFFYHCDYHPGAMDAILVVTEEL